MSQRRRTFGKGYLNALDAFYGEGVVKVSPKRVKRPVDPLNRVKSEEEEHISFVHWLQKFFLAKNIKFFHPANGGHRNYLEAIKLKSMGVSPGICDIVIPLGRQGFNHLYIELKRTVGGKISPQQKDWIDWLNANGSLAKVAYGCDEAIKIVEEYFK